MFVLLCLYCCVCIVVLLLRLTCSLQLWIWASVCILTNTASTCWCCTSDTPSESSAPSCSSTSSDPTNKQTNKQTNKTNKHLISRAAADRLTTFNWTQDLKNWCTSVNRKWSCTSSTQETHTHTHTHARTHTLKPLISSSPLTLESIDWFIDPSHWQRRDLTWVQPPWM